MTGLSFVCAAGPCQRSLSRVLVPWDLRPYFTVSDLRLDSQLLRNFCYKHSAQTSLKTLSRLLLTWPLTRKWFTDMLLRNWLHNPVVPPLLGADDIENIVSSIVACWTVFTELLPGNALIKSVTIFIVPLRYFYTLYIILNYIHFRTLLVEVTYHSDFNADLKNIRKYVHGLNFGCHMGSS
jgi:hypothetical protein